jgi:hypothetical protein
MNVSESRASDNPTEHVYLKTNPESNQRFEFWVEWYSITRSGLDSCEFEL